MNPVVELRRLSGLTQAALAQLAGTSQPTIAQYESGAKSPTLATLKKLAAALGLEMMVNFVPPMSREDRRSLAYHRAIAQILKKAGPPSIQHARKNLKKMWQAHPDARALLEEWSHWLELPTDTLIRRVLDPGLMAREMRQVTPFAGLLSPQERVQILKKFRKESIHEAQRI